MSTCGSSYSDVNYVANNLCDGAKCNDYSNCLSQCCDLVNYGTCWSSSHCYDNSGLPDLSWLWYTLGAVILLIILIVCCIQAKRHKEKNELRQNLYANTHENNHSLVGGI